MLVKGKPRTRGLPAPTPVPADKDQAVREEDAGVGGAEEAAADLFKSKVKPAQVCFAPFFLKPRKCCTAAVHYNKFVYGLRLIVFAGACGEDNLSKICSAAKAGS